MFTGDKNETFRGLMEQFEASRPPAPRRAAVRAAHKAGASVTGAPDAIGETRDEFMRPGVQHRAMQRLRQGKFRAGADERIDLHGFKRDEAHRLFHKFLDDCLARGVRYAVIVCGKGLHSPTGKPVLKLSIRSWLVQHRKVLAYCPARIRDGGTGALYVLLKAGGGE